MDSEAPSSENGSSCGPWLEAITACGSSDVAATALLTSARFFTTPLVMVTAALPRAVFIARAASIPAPVTSTCPARRPVMTPGLPTKAVTAAMSTFEIEAFQLKVGASPSIAAICPL